MELNFNKKGNEYIAEFKVTGDFSLHVERDEAGRFDIYQRTTQDGEYASIENLKYQYGKKIIDYDFIGYVYPKNIKIISRSKPTYAAVVSDGEITELKFQDKSVEITANGTTSITPDNGFAALNSVKVKTNVPTSGEGGGSIEYRDVRELHSVTKANLIDLIAFMVRIEMDGIFMTLGAVQAKEATATMGGLDIIVAISTDLNAKYITSTSEGEITMTCKEILVQHGWWENYNSCPIITEEEFYTL